MNQTNLNNIDSKYLSVGELAANLNQALERQFPEVCFKGEISQVTLARSGHLYLSIKDNNGQLAAVMWAGSVANLGFEVQVGQSVLCHGRPNLYRASGKLQIVLHRLMLAGEGVLQKKFLEMKTKLENEGLFDLQRKRRLPFLPKGIGIITSKSGAVIHDIMVRLKERMPQIPTYLVDVKVQGEGAAQDIAEAIALLDNSLLVDVIIVARGGGSLEDLWAFNEEVVVRAIFASRTPIVSGVGHEVDVTLSDLAADLRAPTPTAAAEMVSPKRADLLQQLQGFDRRLNDTDRWFLPLVQRLDEVSMRIDNAVLNRFEQTKLKLVSIAHALKSIQPSSLIKNLHSKLDLAQQKLLQSVSINIRTQQHSLDRLLVRLEAISPLSVMRRGFAIVELSDAIVKSAEQLTIGQDVRIRLAKGAVAATVTKKFKEHA